MPIGGLSIDSKYRMNIKSVIVKRKEVFRMKRKRNWRRLFNLAGLLTAILMLVEIYLIHFGIVIVFAPLWIVAAWSILDLITGGGLDKQ